MIEFALLFANPQGTQALDLSTEVQTIRTKLRAEQRSSLLKLHLVRDASPSAIEEALRWTTPSPSKRRTATVATELAGHRIEPGQTLLRTALARLAEIRDPALWIERVGAASPLAG